MVYWVAYIRGSFSLKERYLRAEEARSRCNDLLTMAHFIRIMVAEEDEHAPLPNYFALPSVAKH